MGLFKADFFRFLAIGFGAGAVLVLATIGIDYGSETHGVVPHAVAAQP